MARLLPPERDISVLDAPVRSSLGLLGIFLLVIVTFGLLERIGLEGGFAPIAVVVTALALFILVALSSHSRRPVDFYIADRMISGPYNGVACASIFAGLAAVGLAGDAADWNAAFFVQATGLCVGFLLLAFLIAPGLRRFGAYTIGDFLALRFGGFWARVVGACVAFTAAFLIVVVHLRIAGGLLASLIGLPPETALYVATALTILAVLPGGMRSLTWSQGIQYLVMALAALLTAAFLGVGTSPDVVIVEQVSQQLAQTLPAWGDGVLVGLVLPALVTAAGAAALPLFTVRALTVPSPRQAGSAMLWALVFSVLVAFAGLILSQRLADIVEIGALPGAAGGLLQPALLFAKLPAVLAGLVIAGTLAALFALGQAALFSATTAISHDLWDEIFDRTGPEGRRILVARLVAVGIAATAASLVPMLQANVAVLLAWALAFAAAGGFVPLVVGFWWRRCNDAGAVGGMLAGFGFVLLEFLLEQGLAAGGADVGGWTGLGPQTTALIGLLLSLAATIGVSLMTAAPGADTQKMMDALRRRGRLPIHERPA